MSGEKFETLIKEKNVKYKDRWKPITISQIELEFKNGILKDMPIAIRKNITYNLQYLEYLTFQFKELELNSAIYMSLIKNYIIIGSSIIEAIFYWIVKSNNLYNTSDLELVYTTSSNPKKHNGEQFVTETNVYRKVQKYEIDMNYDTLIKKIESKKLLNLNHNVFPYIKKFRQLRNRVHLQIIQNDKDTDWWSFKYYDYLIMRAVLYFVLSDKNINIYGKDNSKFWFLKFTPKELTDLSNYLKKDKEEAEDIRW